MELTADQIPFAHLHVRENLAQNSEYLKPKDKNS